LPHLIRLEHAVLAVYHDDDRVLDTLRCEPAVRRVAWHICCAPCAGPRCRARTSGRAGCVRRGAFSATAAVTTATRT